ncbi:hypothetical protein KVR01_008836 [Diaporthe batatas]|uniref:uncharacterized protein n=1 Tax=Diaporthe batatas TaxID=748121 RepID=UPI001D056250|nr:uncharacterized protein KVR01_008836 [Diaporthe batatas]KAG8161849.1 hypothetical protein KVR01_008836 [Diaporthe batatas]
MDTIGHVTWVLDAPQPQCCPCAATAYPGWTYNHHRGMWLTCLGCGGGAAAGVLSGPPVYRVEHQCPGCLIDGVRVFHRPVVVERDNPAAEERERERRERANLAGARPRPRARSRSRSRAPPVPPHRVGRDQRARRSHHGGGGRMSMGPPPPPPAVVEGEDRGLGVPHRAGVCAAPAAQVRVVDGSRAGASVLLPPPAPPAWAIVVCGPIILDPEEIAVVRAPGPTGRRASVI